MNDNLPKRKTNRLSGYNYSENGLYFVTICTQERDSLFGNVIDESMVLNDIGTMIQDHWLRLPIKFPSLELDEYEIMPDHLHAIIVVGADPRVRPRDLGSTHGSTPTLGTYMQWFKTMTTNKYMQNIHDKNWPRFNRRLWQRNYYEHIIRNEEDLNRIRSYIKDNPKNWEKESTPS